VLGSATFTGEWSGTFVDVYGKKQTALLTLRRTRTPAGSFEDDASPLAGELVVSGSTRYAVSGRPEWWRGRRRNSLALRARLASYAEDGGRFTAGARFPFLGHGIAIGLISRAQATE
jgi:hypothetical protein